MRTSLYRFFDAGDVLLYVGISYDPFMRYGQHLSRKCMRDVVRMEIEWFEDAVVAAKAEVDAIIAECPLWNVKHNRRPQTRTLSHVEHAAYSEIIGPVQPTGHGYAVAPAGECPEWAEYIDLGVPVAFSWVLRMLRAGDLLWTHPDLDIPDECWRVAREKRFCIQHGGSPIAPFNKFAGVETS